MLYTEVKREDRTLRMAADSRVILGKILATKHGYFMLKRLFDIVGGLVGLLLSAPILLIVAICIKIEEPHGTIFFKQKRIGKDGKPFQMFKVRSMVMDAEKKLVELSKYNEAEGHMFKIKADPRITRIGKIIRRRSIDELPQFWNVLIGDMSLIGPRPPLEREVDEYSEYDKQRLLVKPGCSGIWQISGRNELGFDEMVQLDLHYIQHVSLRTDLMIIFKTIGIIIMPHGAY